LFSLGLVPSEGRTLAGAMQRFNDAGGLGHMWRSWVLLAEVGVAVTEGERFNAEVQCANLVASASGATGVGR